MLKISAVELHNHTTRALDSSDHTDTSSRRRWCWSKADDSLVDKMQQALLRQAGRNSRRQQTENCDTALIDAAACLLFEPSVTDNKVATV